MDYQYCFVITTLPNSEAAEKISRTLVESQLAACVNIMDKVSSVYAWKGEIVQDKECMLFIKTKKTLFENLKEEILKHHPYDVPEIIAIPIVDGHSAYFDWIENVVK